MENFPYREPTEELAGALTNPDMILPYQTSRSRSLSPTVRKLLSPSVMSPFFANQSLRPYDSTTTLDKPQKYRKPLVDQSRDALESPSPSLPETWQNEGDLNSASATGTNYAPLSDLSSIPNRDAAVRDEEDSYEHVGRDMKIPGATAVLDDGKILLDNGQKRLSPNGLSHSVGKIEERPLTFVEEDGTDPFSHAAEILANAKRRLTDMEDNLSRARRSLSVTPSTSRSGIGIRRRISPTERDSQSYDSWTLHSLKNRQPSANTHTRVSSETSVPAPEMNVLLARRQYYEQQRSSSAMGSMGPSYKAEDGPESPDLYPNGTWGAINRSISLGGRHRLPLEPLREDDSVFSLDSAVERDERLGHESDVKENPKLVTRARSSLQMRDLHERMQELKGQLTSLKLRTDRDNMHRRSLQTLKTPSPFTVARDWTNAEPYVKLPPNHVEKDLKETLPTAPKSSSKSTSPRSALMVGTRKYEIPEDETDTEDIASSDIENVLDTSFTEHYDTNFSSPAASMDDISSQLQLSPTSDAFYDSYRGDSEADEPTLEESHENRPDAFDYGHFFLHSGMGTFSRINPGRRDSQSSTGSAETTKAPPVVLEGPDGSTAGKDYQSRRAGKHSRQNSGDSISTVNTFATAAEGRETPKMEEDESLDLHPSIVRQPIHKKSLDEGNFTYRNRPVQQGLQQGAYLNHPLSNGRYLPSKKQNGSSVFTGGQPSVLPALLASAVSRKGNRPVEVELNEDDTMLVQHVLQSLHTACQNLSSRNSLINSYERTIWRQRLKAAQQVMEGNTDLDGCTF